MVLSKVSLRGSVRSGLDHVEHPVDEVAGAFRDLAALDGIAPEHVGAAALHDRGHLLQGLATVDGIRAEHGAALAAEHGKVPQTGGPARSLAHEDGTVGPAADD